LGTVPVNEAPAITGNAVEQLNPVSEASVGAPVMAMGGPPLSADASDVAPDMSSSGQYASGVVVTAGDIRPRYMVLRSGVLAWFSLRRIPAAEMSTQTSRPVTSQLSGHAGISPQNRYDLSSPFGTLTLTWVLRPIFP